MTLWAEVGSSVLLYFLVFGMSATVDIRQLRKQVRNRNAILIGISLQFIILPFLGFVVVKLLKMNSTIGITLLVVTSSPGGSYSNWWCSLFNADLALSVTMTTISTILSIVMLPVNLVLYVTTTYSNEVVKSLDWTALFISLVVVIGGIFTGLLSSAYIRSPKFNLLANKLGNIAGVALVTFSIVVSSSGHKGDLWNQSPIFYVAVAAPCLIGLLVATAMVTYFKLAKPERVAVAVECCYQNTGIATSVAASIFTGDELAVAVGVPLFYGICEAVFLAIYCITCWKIGWTKAPPDENFCRVIFTSYEVKEMMEHNQQSIEVILGAPDPLIFSSSKEGYQIDEVSLESISNHQSNDSGDRDGDFTIDDVEEDTVNGEAVEFEMAHESDVDGARTRGYETVEIHSPDTKRSLSASPIPPQPLPEFEKQGNPVSNAISTLRAARPKKYTRAADEEIPATGKSID